MCLLDKPVMEDSEGPGSPPPYKMIQTIGLSVGAAVAYIIAVLGLMFYCKKRCKAKRLQKQPEGEEPEMECLNGGSPCSGRWTGLGTEHPPVPAVDLRAGAEATSPLAANLELLHSQGLGFSTAWLGTPSSVKPLGSAFPPTGKAQINLACVYMCLLHVFSVVSLQGQYLSIFSLIPLITRCSLRALLGLHSV